MPTLLLIEGLRFYFFSDERQEPPHVHVRKGFEHQVFFIERWNEHFGHQR